MTTRYKNPPIREAVFDVIVESNVEYTSALFDSLAEELKNNFPERDIITEGEISLQFNKGTEPSFESKSQECGVKLISTDRTKIVQLKKNGFTFSKLKPYTTWDDFYAEASVLFEKFSAAYGQNFLVKRAALRYINAVNIPKSSFEIGDYFLTSPKLSDNLAHNITNFFMRLVVSDDESDSSAFINQAIEKTNQEETVILFDIDVFMSGLSFKRSEFDMNEIFTQLKTFRTKIFEESITDEVRKLIN